MTTTVFNFRIKNPLLSSPLAGSPLTSAKSAGLIIVQPTMAANYSDAAATTLGTATLRGNYAGTPSWSLTDDASGKYAIDSSTGAITVAGALTAGVDTIIIAVSGTLPVPRPAVGAIEVRTGAAVDYLTFF